MSGSVFPRGPVWFIKLPHPTLDKPKRGSSGVRIGEGVRERKASYEAALKVRDQWQADLDKPKAAAVEGVTLAFAVGRFFTGKVKLGKSIRAAVARGEDASKTAIARNFLSTAERLYDGFGANTLIENITTPLISAWRDKLLVTGRRVAVKGKAGGAKVETDQGLAPGSINAYLRVLSAVLHREHAEYQTLKAVPAIPMLDDEADDEEGEVVALADDEADRLVAASPVYLQRIILFSLNTGARKTEMMKLTWDKIEGLEVGANGRALVNFWKNTKRNKKRSLFLPDGLRDMLRQMRQEQIDGGYDGNRVFAFRHKYSPNKWFDPAGLQETVWAAREAAGLPDFTLHVCRHTFACRVLQRGGTLALVSQLLGHSDLKTTQIYAKFAPENRADAAAFLDRDWQSSAAARHASL